MPKNEVKSNIPDEVPADFMYQLTQKEKDDLVAICDHLKSLKFLPQLPYVFTEHGAVMLASVLNSDRAIEVNIQIVRIFTKMRELLLTNQEILLKLEELERKIDVHDGNIVVIFQCLKQLLNPPEEPRPRIGFRRKDESN